MIDLYCHILPGIDDGPETWEESLKMADLAVRDGIRTLVATPHLFPHRTVDPGECNDRKTIIQKIEDFRASLTGLFGHWVAKLSRTLVKKGYIHLLASDAHSSRGRTPQLSEAVALLARIIGKETAQAMVTTFPAKIIRGEDII